MIYIVSRKEKIMPTTKIPFRTAYSGQKEHYCPTGDGKAEEYGYEYNNKNQKVLVKTGEKDLYKEIQSYHDSTRIENILARVAIGDMSDFRPDGIYTDATKIPNNLIEAKKEMLKVENLWNHMPNDVKREYNFNIDEFMAAAGTEAWLIQTGLINPLPVEKEQKAEAPETTVETPNE